MTHFRSGNGRFRAVGSSAEGHRLTREAGILSRSSDPEGGGIEKVAQVQEAGC
jgi:hypothetical protein